MVKAIGRMFKYFRELTVFLLVLLWVYAAASKLIEFPHFKHEMHNQVFFPFIQELLIYLLPPVELVVAVMLSYSKTEKLGLYVSALMLMLFTGYIALAKLHFFRRIPCSCGGILEHMGWTAHLIFNMFFLALIMVAVFGTKERRTVTV
jgi:putative oxidoreductase